MGTEQRQVTDDPATGTEVAETSAEPGDTAELSETPSGTTGDTAEPGGTTEPGEVEEDRWAAFAPAPEHPPGWFRRARAMLGRGLVHEWTLAVLGALVLAVVMTWPALRHPRYTLPQDLGDPALVGWVLSWSGHALLTDPTQLWHANPFFPERWSYAFTDSLLGYAPAGMIGSGPLDAVLRYNIIYVLVHALAFVGAYALVRQLGAGRTGAVVAGAAFAYAPWRLAHAGHLHVLSTGGIALALAMLARGHGWSLRHGFRGRRVRPKWIIAGWLVAAWQITLGFGIGLLFAYALALIAVIVLVGWLVRRVLRRRRQPFGAILTADVLGGALFSGVALLMALPYLTVLRLHPAAQRTIAEVELFSPPLRGFFTAPDHSVLWGSAHAGLRELPVTADKPFWPAEMALLPGFALLGLAAAGLFISIWTWRVRLALAAGVVATVILGMGSEAFDGDVYLPLHDLLPGWDGLRTPGRLIIWTTLLLGVLAAGAVCALAARTVELTRSGALAARRASPRPGPWLRLATLLPLLLVLAEGVSDTPHPVVPPRPPALAGAAGPMLVLPSNPVGDMQVMLWTTDRFPPLVNGGSGFVPESLAETRQVTTTFPDTASVSYLRSLGVATVVVLGDRVVGTPWEGALEASVDGLGVTREEVAGGIIFHLDP